MLSVTRGHAIKLMSSDIRITDRPSERVPRDTLCLLLLETGASRNETWGSAIHLLSRLLWRSTKDLICPSRAAITDMASQRLLYHALFSPVSSRFLAFYITTRFVLGRLTCSPLAFTASSTLRTTITPNLLTCSMSP